VAINEEIRELLAAFAEFTKNEVRKSAREKGITFGGEDSRMLSDDKTFVSRFETTSNSLKLIIEIVPERAPYAVAVDKGRSAGKAPPIEPLKKWIRRKGILKSEKPTKGEKKTKQTKKARPSFEKRLTSMAWGISKNIGKKGTIKRFGYKGKPFLTEEIPQLEKDITQEFE